MKIVTLSLLAALAATPAVAQAAADPGNAPSSAADSATAVTPPAQNPNVDDRTAAVDTARQREYANRLDAANAQAKVDSAAADRDAAQARADAAHDDKNAAKDAAKYP